MANCSCVRRERCFVSFASVFHARARASFFLSRALALLSRLTVLYVSDAVSFKRVLRGYKIVCLIFVSIV